MLKSLILILPLFLLLQIHGQNSSCDTIYLNNGKKIVGNIVKEKRTSYVYHLCCEGCSEEHQVEKKDIQSASFTDSTEAILDEYYYATITPSPWSVNYKLGGPTLGIGVFLECQPVKHFGFTVGVGAPIDGFTANLSFLFPMGGRVKFIPSVGITSLGGGPALTSFYNVQFRSKKKKNKYIRFGPGVILSDDSFAPVLPWFSFSSGIYFGS